MWEFIQKLGSTDGFMPHGHCYMWETGAFWLTVFSDALIAASYFSIPFLLYYVVHRRRDIEHRHIAHLFVAFILLCGTTHLLGLIGMWHPFYRLEGVVKLATGLVSATTAVTLAYIVPQVLSIPHPKEYQRTRDRLAEETRNRRQAIAANNMKSQFLATMSHEIRTPMYGIVGALDLLDTQVSDVEQREVLSLARESAQRLILILNDVLDLAKAEAGRIELAQEPFLVGQWIVGCVELTNFQAQAKGIQLKAEVDPSIPPVLVGDKTRLGQILVNLLSNAVKFTHEGSVTVRLKSLAQTDHKQELLLEVEDTGVGISPENLQRIFEAFAQERPSTAAKFGGTGLGLAIAREIVRAMGGSLDVRSTVGKGSCFAAKFTLTFASAEDLQRLLNRERREEVNLLTQRSVQPLKVALVDDAPMNQDVTSLILKERGHEVVLFDRAPALIPYLEHHSIDVVMMDMVIAEDSGLELCQQVRAHRLPRVRHVPIAGFSAQAGVADREAALAAGMDIYITKPVIATHLIQSIEELAERYRQRADDSA